MILKELHVFRSEDTRKSTNALKYRCGPQKIDRKGISPIQEFGWYHCPNAGIYI
jgi:hypothetical protein